MMKGFVYAQHSGEFSIVNGHYGCPLAAGYAGSGAGRNNPDLDHVRSVGPLPRGIYRCETLASAKFAAPAICLDPHPANEMHGRSGFWIHGDNASGSASSGCIVLDKITRETIRALIRIGFDQLEVVE